MDLFHCYVVCNLSASNILQRIIKFPIDAPIFAQKNTKYNITQQSMINCMSIYLKLLIVVSNESNIDVRDMF